MFFRPHFVLLKLKDKLMHWDFKTKVLCIGDNGFGRRHKLLAFKYKDRLHSFMNNKDFYGDFAVKNMQGSSHVGPV